MKAVFALADCNNFYASCERLFRPDLSRRPVVVLSNNDGCVIARSTEAKQLGINMGVPVFQVQHLLQRHRIQVFSANFPLYADMSARVMTTLETLVPKVEIYSIDEAFLDLTGLAQQDATFGQQIRQTVLRWTGLPVSIGIAPTRTLAKLANYAAKCYPATQGVVDLTSRQRQRKLLALTPVAEIWGIGRKLTLHLKNEGIHTALQLADAQPQHIRRKFSILVERTLRELNGEACIEPDFFSDTKKQLIYSRSFARRITSKQKMQEVLCHYSSRACEKLRQQKLQAKVFSIFIRTSLFQSDVPGYNGSQSVELALPSSDTRDFIEQALRLLEIIWKDGYRYAKAGIILSELYTPASYQPDLFSSMTQRPNGKALMQVLDNINLSGKGHIWFAGQGMPQHGLAKSAFRSPAYTTRWTDIPSVE